MDVKPVQGWRCGSAAENLISRREAQDLMAAIKDQRAPFNI